MYIESLYIADFGGTKNRHIRFEDKINVIEGANESGKSTLAAFIKFIFYGFRDKADRHRYYSWGKDSAGGSAVVACRDKRYRIEREHNESSGDRVRIFDLETNLPAFEGLKPDEVFLGVSGDIFAQTAFVPQASGGYIQGHKVSSSIENILFSADETIDTTKALKRLDEARIILQHKRGNGGRLSELARERDELIKRLETAKQSSSAIIEKEGTHRDTLATIEKNREKLQEHKDLLQYYEAAKAYRTYKKHKTLSRKATELESLNHALAESYTYEGFLPDEEYIAQLRSLNEDILRYEESEIQLHQETERQRMRDFDLYDRSMFIGRVNEKGGLNNVVSAFKKIVARKRNMMILSIVSFLLALVTAVVTVMLWNVKSVPVYGGLSILALVLLGLIFIICSSRQRINLDEFLAELDVDSPEDFNKAISNFVADENRLSLHNSQINDLEYRFEQIQLAKREKEDRAMALALKWGMSDYTEAPERAAEVLRLISDNRNEYQKYAIARDSFKEQAESLDPDALREILAGRPYTEDAFDMDKVNEALRENDFYLKSTEALTLRAQELEKELAVLYATAENPTLLEDKVNELTRELNSLTKKLNGYILAYEKLEEASKALRMSVSPRLSRYAAELLSRMTDGRYTTLGVSTEFEMRYEVDGRNHELDYMSTGTRDLAYYALRISLVKLLYKKELPPIVFDESFSALDDKRLDKMLTVVSELSEDGMQTLLFTSQTRDALALNQNGIAFNHIKL